MRLKILISVISLAIIALVVSASYYYTRNINITTTSTPSPSPSPTQTPQPLNQTPADWQSYTSNQNSLSLSAPASAEINETSEGTTIVFRGPTQGQTEITDGFKIIINSGEFEDPFREFAEQQYNDVQENPTTTEISPIQKASINSLTGFSFTSTSLGQSTTYLLEAPNNTYIKIVTIIPETEESNYEETVNQILQTLTPISN